MSDPDTTPTTDEPAQEDMFYAGVYWVWDVPEIGLRVATPEECATEIKRLREEVAVLKIELEGAAHNRFYDQRDAYFEGVEDGR